MLLVALGIAWLADVCFLIGQLGRIPSVVDLILPCAISAVAAGLVLIARRGHGTITKYLLTGATVLGVGLVTTLFALSDVVPSIVDSPGMTEANRQDLRQLLRRLSKENEEQAHLFLTQADLNLLATRWLESDHSNARRDVRILEHELQARVSLVCPPICVGKRYLNLELHFDQAGFAAPSVLPALSAIRLGGFDFPQTWTTAAAAVGSTVLSQHASTAPYVDAIVNCRFEPERLEVTGNFRHGQSLLNVGPASDQSLGETVEFYCEVVRRAAPSGPAGDARFLHLLGAALRAAAERSQTGDVACAADENKAALVAFGIVVGNPSLREIAESHVQPDAHNQPRLRISGVTLRGRSDWVRHFAMSAALKVLHSETLSRTAGVLKEELDAGRGGSGFSFGDLLADEAGIRFATAATCDEQSALRVQQLFLAGSARIDDLFPPANDLPEDIPASQLQDQFGGVGGSGYMTLSQEMNRRLSQCSLLR
jgi:hypothetical protein